MRLNDVFIAEVVTVERCESTEQILFENVLGSRLILGGRKGTIFSEERIVYRTKLGNYVDLFSGERYKLYSKGINGKNILGKSFLDDRTYLIPLASEFDIADIECNKLSKEEARELIKTRKLKRYR